MKKLIIANWKMNGNAEFASVFAAGLNQFLGKNGKFSTDIVICPPFTLIEKLSKTFDGSGVAIGSQDCHTEKSGAFTGGISAQMLKEIGVLYIIVGHSERRKFEGETSDIISKKANAAIAENIIPVVCVGESLEQRKSGGAQEIVVEELLKSIPKSGDFIVAYEPIWAIGSGLTPSVAEISAMHIAIKSAVNGAKVLYGGSVNERNAEEILHAEGVDGALIGGASLNIEAFCSILNEAEN